MSVSTTVSLVAVFLALVALMAVIAGTLVRPMFRLSRSKRYQAHTAIARQLSAERLHSPGQRRTTSSEASTEAHDSAHRARLDAHPHRRSERRGQVGPTGGLPTRVRDASPTRRAAHLHGISTRATYPQWVSGDRTRGVAMDVLKYTVPGMHCGHCKTAVTEEVSSVPGVESVVVDLDSKRVEVTGTALDDAAIRAAIDEAGYEAA